MTPQVQYIVKIITWAECPETSPDHPDDPDSETQHGKRPNVACQTQRGRRPEGQTQPIVVRALRARQDPAWSKASGQDKTQRGRRLEGQTRPSEVRVLRTSPRQVKTQRGPSPQDKSRPSVVRALRTSQDPAWSEAQRGQTDPVRSEPTVTVKSRHEFVPQPEGQSASRPECLATQPCPGCFLRPRASRSSSLGRGVGPVFLFLAPSFSSLFCRFSVLVSLGVFLKQEVRGSHFGHPRG